MPIDKIPVASCGKECIWLLVHEREGGGHVVVLQRAGVVVQQGQRVARADEEVIVDAPVSDSQVGLTRR